MSNKIFIIFCSFFIIGCSAPKIGKDVLIDINRDSVRLENSKMDVALEILALTGLPVEHTAVKISADLNITNKWHSDIVLKKLTYNLVSEGESLANGNACIISPDGTNIAASHSLKIPLILIIDPKNITISKTITRAIKQQSFFLKGEVITSVYGKEFRHSFNKNIKDLKTSSVKRF